jgi:peptide/nickel transport system ATP-binding protein
MKCSIPITYRIKPLVLKAVSGSTSFEKPVHPYTKALLSAIPIPSVKNRRKRTILKGELSSPIEPEERCRFAGRCVYVKERCQHEVPELREIKPGHFCACHFTEEVNA